MVSYDQARVAEGLIGLSLSLLGWLFLKGKIGPKPGSDPKQDEWRAKHIDTGTFAAVVTAAYSVFKIISAFL